MNRKILIPAVLLVALLGWNCEKDDICSEDTSTTPRLVMQFNNIDDPTAAKNVTSLLVTTNNGLDTLGIYSGVSKVELPLRTLTDSTEYRFTLNSATPEFDNTDDLEFFYTRDQIYVSRACGYKMVYLLDGVTPFTQVNGTDGQWMQNVTVQQPDIQTEDEVHISVLF